MNKSTSTSPDIPIVFEDNYLLVIDKPHELLSQEDHTGDPDVVTLCKQYLRQEYNNRGNVYLGLVHRLDRPVGGLMLLAKTQKAAKQLSDQLRDRTVQKTYHAIVYGDPPLNGFLTHHLVKNRNRNRVTTASPKNQDSKKAILSFQRLEQQEELSLLAVHLQTGRPHQIRVQLAEEGYPVWGDYKYGRRQPDGRTMALRAVELIFQHPMSKEDVQLTLPSPKAEPWSLFNCAK
ncbi:RluA family pseudouridine synthase [Aliifodinibius sp. S!AR15-10]|uniref:RluA family pseudouridine synthase n=1 Tax=Aliifodinibius sp. S!AR15-10 TaxID=2950437 RepID=UPI002860300F|nr:RluA family pseudouridine synthase [Aliifodinibius sp. S!AR15-10]MDR8391154.1 RluA family pseudouridine synthase [Aliifodinibius sp. S!AR15-10]